MFSGEIQETSSVSAWGKKDYPAKMSSLPAMDRGHTARVSRMDGTCAQPLCVANFYKNKTIFITGATGFMGKVLLEKLLRSCPDIKKCYTLVRPKKNQTPQERIESVIKSKVCMHLEIT